MAEALGVAGSVVGIISLGLQISQGLMKYYGSWSDQDNVVSDMFASLKGLLETLMILSKAIQPPAIFDKITKDNVEENVNRTNRALKKLEDELKEVQGIETPKPGARATMRRHIRRALYPFREETLNKI